MSNRTEPKPLVFIIHGAWATNWSFAPLLPELWKRGFPTWCREQPHAWGDPSANLADTHNFIRTELQELLDKGYDVVVVFHSLGGVLGPHALEGFFKKDRQGDGNSNGNGKGNGIIGMVYSSCPIVPRRGITSEENQKYWGSDDWFGGKPEQAMEFGPLIYLKDSSFFTEGVPYPPEILQAQLRPVSYATFGQPLEYDPLIKENPDNPDEAGTFPVPTAYLVCLRDPTITTATQERVVKKYEGKFAEVGKVDTVHLWAMAEPVKTAELIAGFAGRL